MILVAYFDFIVLIMICLCPEIVYMLCYDMTILRKIEVIQHTLYDSGQNKNVKQENRMISKYIALVYRINVAIIAINDGGVAIFHICHTTVRKHDNRVILVFSSFTALLLKKLSVQLHSCVIFVYVFFASAFCATFKINSNLYT